MDSRPSLTSDTRPRPVFADSFCADLPIAVINGAAGVRSRTRC
jgi:hypothetical protein